MPNEQIKKMVCEQHGIYETKTTVIFGKEFSVRCPLCQADENERIERERLKINSANKTHRIEKLLSQSAIPPRFKNRSFENFNTDTPEKKQAMQMCRSMALNFDECLKHGTSLLMCGKPGTGKSHLSVAFAIEVINQGRSAAYTTVLRAIRSIKDTYRKNSELTEQQAINAFISPDLLVLDEVGVQFGSETEKMYLFEILNGRYENQKPTIVITNLSPDEVSDYLGERVIDRLSEGGGGTLVFDWESYRSKVVNDNRLPVAEPKPVSWVGDKKIL
jgi:DNA replication protein DnaC